jgi:hypothetical protein
MQNRRFQRLMTAELQRKQLGPFAAPVSVPSSESAPAIADAGREASA